jgi:DNA-binding transcriptional MerR regulator
MKVGELSKRAGVSVRALHHYEEIGLLVPSGRTDAGHRVYAPADVERLARITALAALGFSLDQIRACLDGEERDLVGLVATHLARAREALVEQQELTARLEMLHERLVAAPDDVEQLLATVEVMTMIERYYTKEQLDQLAQRREELGEDAIKDVENAWAALFAEVKALLDAGTPADAPAAQALARRWTALTKQTVAGFTGGDPGIKGSLDRMYQEQPVDKIHPSFDPRVFAYMKEAAAKLG